MNACFLRKMATSLKSNVVLEIVLRNVQEMELFFNDIKMKIDTLHEDKVNILKLNRYLEKAEKLSLLMIEVRNEGEKLG